MLFVVWKFAILAFALAAPLILPLKSEKMGRALGIGLPYLTWIWANFDGVHYSYIAQHGYQYPNFAFFPLLPLLIHLVKQILSVHAVNAGLLIVHVSLFLSAIALYKIVSLDYSKDVALGSVAMLFLFPLSFFYGAVYTESLFLLTSVLSFYFARKGEWLKAGILGYFASAARLVGIALLPALFAEWFIMQKGGTKNSKLLMKKFFREKTFFMLLIPLGLASYMVYLQLVYGDFLLFQKSMADWGQAQIVFPPQVLFRYYKILLTVPLNTAYFIAVVEVIATILYFLLSVFVLRRVRLSYGVFMLVLLTIPTFTGTFQSMPRYILQLFPAFIGLSLLMRSRPLFIITLIVFLLLQFLFVSMFTRGYFIT